HGKSEWRDAAREAAASGTLDGSAARDRGGVRRIARRRGRDYAAGAPVRTPCVSRLHNSHPATRSVGAAVDRSRSTDGRALSKTDPLAARISRCAVSRREPAGSGNGGAAGVVTANLSRDVSGAGGRSGAGDDGVSRLAHRVVHLEGFANGGFDAEVFAYTIAAGGGHLLMKRRVRNKRCDGGGHGIGVKHRDELAGAARLDDLWNRAAFCRDHGNAASHRL